MKGHLADQTATETRLLRQCKRLHINKKALLVLTLLFFSMTFSTAANAYNGYIYGYKATRSWDILTMPTHPYVDSMLYHARDALWRTWNGCYAWGGVSTGYPAFTYSSFMDHLNTSGADVIYVQSHGGASPERFATSWGSPERVYDYNVSAVNNRIKRIVFLDACHTAESSDWAEAFKTHGPTIGGFLGWNGLMYLDNWGAWYTFIIWDSMSGYDNKPKKTLGQARNEAAGMTGRYNGSIYGNYNVYM